MNRLNYTFAACVSLAVAFAVNAGAPKAMESFRVGALKKPVAPGIIFSIKNSCGFTSKVFAMDLICTLDMGTWTAGHSVQSGVMANSETIAVAVCADTQGKGLVQFVPFPGMSTPAVNVTPKSGDVVNIPPNLCVRP